MSFDGKYEIVSRFYKIGKHRGLIIIQTEGDNLSGTAIALGKETVLKNGVLLGNEFACNMEMKIPIINKKLLMNVNGCFSGDTVKGTMQALFGKSVFEGKKTLEASGEL